MTGILITLVMLAGLVAAFLLVNAVVVVVCGATIALVRAPFRMLARRLDL